MIETLDDLLHPHDPALLEAAMLARRPLHLRSERAGAFAALMPWEAFNRLPSTRRFGRGDMRITRQGRDVLLDMALSREGGAGAHLLTPEALQSLCHQGMSIVLDRVQDDAAAVAALCALLERHFRCEANANCYAGFRREGAFEPHYDAHDVLVLQLQGAKRWSLYGQPWRLPLKPMFPNPADPGPAEAEVVLEPGDLLYLPRGEVHAAEVAEAPSLHLSIGLRFARGADVLRWLAGLAEAEEAAREDVNALETAEARADHAARLRDLLHRLADGLDLDAFLADADRARAPARPVNLGLSSALAADTRVQPAMRRCIVPDGLGGVERDVLARLIERDCLKVAELAAGLPDHGEDAVRQAVATLARKSLVFLFPPR